MLVAELVSSNQELGHLSPYTDRSALGHCRLSINDLSLDGAQPLHSHDGKIHAVVNGEIYDYAKIRSELEQANYAFSGHSDSELVVALYQIHGPSFVTKLRGEFSFCLFDSDKDYFIAARDRYGIKPLFWTLAAGGDRLLISSEAKGFLPLGWQPTWDVRSIREGGWNHDSRTLFAGVEKVWFPQFGRLETLGLGLTFFLGTSGTLFYAAFFRSTRDRTVLGHDLP